VDLRKPNKTLPLTVPGSLYADINQGTFINVVLKRQFDAIFYLPETTATFEQNETPPCTTGFVADRVAARRANAQHVFQMPSAHQPCHRAGD
jgi:hypothetical protein